MSLIDIQSFYLYYRRLIWLIISAIAVIVGAIVLYENCKSYPYPKELVMADSLCRVNPDSAKVILSSFNPEYYDIDSETGWYYKLLLLQNKIKLGESIASDTEINKIVTHYEDNNNKRLLAQAYYCAGCIYNSLNDSPKALDYFQRAMKIFQKTGNMTDLGLCYYQLGHLLSGQGIYQDALYWQRKSLSLHTKSQDTTRCIYDCEDLAWTLGSLGNEKEALGYIKEALRLAESSGNTADIPEIESQMASHYLNYEKPLEAKKYIDRALRHISGRCPGEFYSIALNVYSKLEIDDTARYFCDKAIENGNIYGRQYAYIWLTRHLIKEGDSDAAINSINKFFAVSDTVKSTLPIEAIAKANALYNYNLRAIENLQLEKENTHKGIVIFIVAFLFVIAICIIPIIYLNNKRKRKLMEARCRSLDSLLKSAKNATESALIAKEKEISAIRTELVDLREKDESRRVELEKLLDLHNSELKNIDTDIKQKKTCDYMFKRTAVYKELVSCCDGPNYGKFVHWNELKQAVFDSYPNFERSLLDYEEMSKIELYTCLLIKCKLNASSIAMLLCKTRTTVYSICKRLYFKNFGEKAPASKWEELISTIY